MADYKDINIRKDRNYAIEAIRFLIMAWIVLFHYTVRYNELSLGTGMVCEYQFTNGGDFGVSLFFIISGFFMTSSLMKIETQGIKGYFLYLCSRYYRLWLPYFFSCLIIFVWMLVFPVNGRTVSLSDLVLNLIFIIHPNVDYVDGAHWFIASLLRYQIFIGFILLIKKMRHRIFALLAVFGILSISQILNNQSILDSWHGGGQNVCISIISKLSSFHLYCVIFGICVGLVMRNWRLFPLIAIGFYCFYHNSPVFLVLVALLVFCLSNIFNRRFCNLIQHTEFFKFLGNISFYWYLLHQNIGYSILVYLSPTEPLSGYMVAVPIVITLILAIVLFYFVQKIQQFISLKIVTIGK